jgi:hypothetical protein
VAAKCSTVFSGTKSESQDYMFLIDSKFSSKVAILPRTLEKPPFYWRKHVSPTLDSMAEKGMIVSMSFVSTFQSVF